MEDRLINEQLIEKLQSIAGCFTLNSEETINIVPWDFMHEILFMHNEIDETIMEFYLKNSRKFVLKTSIGYNEPCKNNLDLKSMLYSPYPFIIEGAFFSRESLCKKLNALIDGHDEMWLNGKKNLKTFLDLKPYFTEYAQGFKNGFNEFENDRIKPFMPMFATKEDYTHKVFQFLKPRSTWTNRGGFVLMLEADKKRTIFNAYGDGQVEGYYYKAWSLIFSQNHIFAPLFKEYSKISNSDNEANSFLKLSINQIALKHFYEGTSITRDNCNHLVKQYGHSSGEKLYQQFIYFSSRANRKGIPKDSTPLKLQNKIELIESVIGLLPDDCKSMAIDECNILKSKVQNDDY